MRINVHAGHNPAGKVACGAVGLINESTEARRVKDEVISKLRQLGHTVYDCTIDNGTGQADVLKKIIPDHTDASQFRYPGPEHFTAVQSWPNAAAYLPNDDISDLYNGDAHLKATVIGSSQTFEVTDSKLGVGTTGYVYFVDFDRTRPRERKCSVVVIGE